MRSFRNITFTIFITFSTNLFFGQNETSKWYFGNQAGLDFMTSPPTILTNGVMSTAEGCSGIANSAGTLLFYTNGVTVWNANHIAMANGTGLFGSGSTSQSGIIVKKPGSSNIYYVFTLTSGFGTLCYSEIDMTLASGTGSVTLKNSPVSSTLTEHLTSVKHCNGTDIWVLAHSGNSSNNFLAYLVSSIGVNTIAIISSVGTSFGSSFIGCMKFSSNGKKLGFAVAGNDLIELFDFNASTGVVSNPLSINGPVSYPYGVEFSPDGTKFYAKGLNCLSQWDLCAGSGAAIAASSSTFVSGSGIGSLQLAKDGKIYTARQTETTLGVVNYPNLLGFGCNYVDVGQSVSPKTSQAGLPNFITSWFKSTSSPFSYTVTCRTTVFKSPAQPTVSLACQNATYSLTSLLWNFGDPGSGTGNSSTNANPTHIFSVNGSFTTQLILYYSCGGGTDTLKQIVTTSSTVPNVSISGNFSLCAGESQVYIAAGASSYSWSNGSANPSISISPTITATYTVTGASPTNSCLGQKIFTVTVSKCLDLSGNYIYMGGINIYPNPGGGIFQIESIFDTEGELFDLRAQKLKSVTIQQGLQTLDLRNLSDGVYFLRVARSSETYKLIKVE